MGAQKLLMDVRGVPMLDRVLDATRDFETIVVTSPEVAHHIRLRPRIQVLQNTKRDLGMAHSFEIANGFAPPEHALLVFLGDKPFVTAALANTIVKQALAAEADVCFPEHENIGGHPVFFSPKARTHSEVLHGELLHALRDAPNLVRVPVPVDDAGAFTDVDTAADLRAVSTRFF
ncbi:MAG TPA: NTP transferase domain-containing protein [Candidatus Rubrimentiphilum sp.]|nr:NTP transferase domain-containing protein [Candidatus Rubrimentiphilum sp.]